MTRQASFPSRRFASVASLKRSSRRRAWIAWAAGLVLGLVVPSLLGGVNALAASASTEGMSRAELGLEPAARDSGQIAWRPAPRRIDSTQMIRLNAGDARRLDIRRMIRP